MLAAYPNLPHARFDLERQRAALSKKYPITTGYDYSDLARFKADIAKSSVGKIEVAGWWTAARHAREMREQKERYLARGLKRGYA